MKPKPKVISYRNMPTGFPLVSTAVAWLLLDRFHAPGWVWAIIGTLFAIFWAICIYLMAVEKQVDIFEDEKAIDRLHNEYVAAAVREVRRAISEKRAN